MPSPQKLASNAIEVADGSPCRPCSEKTRPQLGVLGETEIQAGLQAFHQNWEMGLRWLSSELQVIDIEGDTHLGAEDTMWGQPPFVHSRHSFSLNVIQAGAP